MKTIIIITTLTISIMAISLAFVSKSTKDTEQHKYEVIKKYDNFELRRYEPAIFSSVKLNSKKYKDVSYSGFRVLAGYIFGDNEKNQKIAMTSPVAMAFGDTSEMRFMIPSEYSIEELPKPKDSSINFIRKPEMIMAAIVFDGWADDKKIEKHKNILIDELSKKNIQHTGKFEFLGYNPPYDVIDRRNEVVVEIINYDI